MQLKPVPWTFLVWYTWMNPDTSNAVRRYRPGRSGCRRSPAGLKGKLEPVDPRVVLRDAQRVRHRKCPETGTAGVRDPEQFSGFPIHLQDFSRTEAPSHHACQYKQVVGSARKRNPTLAAKSAPLRVYFGILKMQIWDEWYNGPSRNSGRRETPCKKLQCRNVPMSAGGGLHAHRSWEFRH